MMLALNRLFYSFAGVHSFLIGLFPFFIPVLLWKVGYSALDICMFIVVTSLSFLIALQYWKYLYQKSSWKLLFLAAFVADILLVFTLVNLHHHLTFLLAAVCYGAYNCFYWTTQRFMFAALNPVEGETVSNVGNKFASFQIVAFVFLKMGLFIGAFLIEQSMLWSILIISVMVSIVSLIVCLSFNSGPLMQIIKSTVPFSVDDKESMFSDKSRSKAIFYLDGVFLYLESFFWVLTLYMFTQQNVLQLGLIVIALSIILVAVFMLLKRYIDRVDVQIIYIVGVALYALSWLLRAQLSTLDNANALAYPVILVITFFTMFFRLSFNKRFFDHANKQDTLNYLLAKSYFSQYAILIVFLGIYLAHKVLGYAELNLMYIYITAAAFSLLYWVYASPSLLAKPQVDFEMTGNN